LQKTVEHPENDPFLIETENMKFNHKFMPIQPSKECTMPIEPCKHDVLSGKSKYCFRHSGNQTFRVLIAENVTAYKMAPTKKLKMQIVITVADTVLFQGGRFLTLDSQGCWKDGGLALGKKKVGNAFRDAQRGRLKLTKNACNDGNVCVESHGSSSQERDGKNNFNLDQVGNNFVTDGTNVTSVQESLHQRSQDSESSSGGYHESKWMSQVCSENPFTLESTMDWKTDTTEINWMNNYLDDCVIDAFGQLL
jgi:hypothetical protein